MIDVEKKLLLKKLPLTIGKQRLLTVMQLKKAFPPPLAGENIEQKSKNAFLSTPPIVVCSTRQNAFHEAG